MAEFLIPLLYTTVGTWVGQLGEPKELRFTRTAPWTIGYGSVGFVVALGVAWAQHRF